MSVTILIGDVREQLRTLAADSIHCCVTSPPYWGLRDYGVDGQIGLESTPAEFIATMIGVFEEVRRVLRPDGTCWINMGDSYASTTKGSGGTGNSGLMQDGRAESGRGSADDANARSAFSPRRLGLGGLKPKDICMMPHRLAIALQDAGWWVRQDIVWSKPNPMPESVRDRCTKSHEYIFLLTKGERYYFDQDAIRTPFSGETKAQSFETMEFKKRDRYKRPDGWDTGAGAHGAIHREGREKGQLAPEDYEPSTGANKRSVWTMATHSFAEAHFATFPPELPETCIKAGTSEAGHCPECGKRWSRVIERTPMVIAKTNRNDERGTRTGTSGTMLSPALSVTAGWTPTCACSCDPVPDVVLDPFFGAGTTGLVADRLQRDCIGIELNSSYAEIARRRIQGDSPLFAEVA